MSPMFRRMVPLIAVVSLVAPLAGQARLAADVNSKIRAEANAHSSIMHTLHMLADVYGPRVTGSPSLKAAGEWAIKEMQSWGFANGHLEPWEFGHPGLGQRALLGAHRVAGEGSADRGSAGMDAGNRGHRHCAGVSTRGSRSSDAGATDGVVRIGEEQREGPRRARRQAHAGTGRISLRPPSAGPTIRCARSTTRTTRTRVSSAAAAAAGERAAAADPGQRSQPPRRRIPGRQRRKGAGQRCRARARPDIAFHNRTYDVDQGGADRRAAQRRLRPHLAHSRRRHAGRARVHDRQHGLSRKAGPHTTRSRRSPAATRKTKW